MFALSQLDTIKNLRLKIRKELEYCKMISNSEENAHHDPTADLSELLCKSLEVSQAR